MLDSGQCSKEHSHSLPLEARIRRLPNGWLVCISITLLQQWVWKLNIWTLEMLKFIFPYFAVNHHVWGIEDVKGIAPQNLAATYHDILLFRTSRFVMRSHLLHLDSKSTQPLKKKKKKHGIIHIHNLSNPRSITNLAASTNQPPPSSQALHWKHLAPTAGHGANPLLSQGQQL